MIVGSFRDGHPRLVVTLYGAGGSREMEFTVDTGFDGDLALPNHMAAGLGVEPAGVRRRGLADGAVIGCRFSRIEIEWTTGVRPAEVLFLAGRPLLGTALLEDHLLQVQVTEGGEVIVEPL